MSGAQCVMMDGELLKLKLLADSLDDLLKMLLHLMEEMFPDGTGPIWLDDVECIGTEISLFNCTAMPIGVHNCRHFEDIGVNCQGINLHV